MFSVLDSVSRDDDIMEGMDFVNESRRAGDNSQGGEQNNSDGNFIDSLDTKEKEKKVIKTYNELDLETVVMDMGSGYIRVGTAQNENPQYTFSTTIGSLQHDGFLEETGGRKIIYGAEISEKLDFLNVSRPIRNGSVRNYGHFKSLCGYILRSDPSLEPTEHGVMITEPAGKKRPERHKMVNIMFEHYGIPALFIGTRELLALYGSGLTTGVMVGCGEDTTTIFPVYESTTIVDACSSSILGGRHVTEYLQKIMEERRRKSLEPKQTFFLNRLKEQGCYTSLNYKSELKKMSEQKEFRLPDGSRFLLTEERFRSPEVLFQPFLLSNPEIAETKGIHNLVNESIQKCDIDLRKELYGSIILWGGSTLFENFEERIRKEIYNGAKRQYKRYVKAFGPPERRDLAWRGAKVIQSMKKFRKHWVTKDEFEEIGPSIVHRRIFQ